MSRAGSELGVQTKPLGLKAVDLLFSKGSHLKPLTNDLVSIEA
jgi:hypothetical protein